MTPVAVAYFPVWSVLRAGPQTGWLVNAWWKRTPADAMRSKLGVMPMGLPYAPMLSARCWSVKKIMTFGREPEPVAAAPAPAAAKGVVRKCRLFINTPVYGSLHLFPR